MSYTPNGDSKCDEILQTLDEHFGKNLGAEAACKVQDHLETCVACAREAALRAQLRARLKSAVHNFETPAFLEARIRADLRTGGRRAYWTIAVAAVAACLLVVVG